MWPPNLKVFIAWPFIEKVCWPLAAAVNFLFYIECQTLFKVLGLHYLF